MADPLEKARDQKRNHEAQWLGIDGVVAVGISQPDGGTPVIVVSVEADTIDIRRAIPDEVDGVPIQIRVTGPIRPM
jgi:hypothetical protein